MINTTIVNLFGGPGCGKSTAACAAFSRLKLAGVNCELAPEYAKELVWDGAHFLLQQNPIHGFSEQYRRILRLIGKVDVVITDSPILLYAYYQRWSPELDALILAEHHKWHTINFWIDRAKPYHQEGRMETEAQAQIVDATLHGRLRSWNIPLRYVFGNDQAGWTVANYILACKGSKDASV